VNRKLTRHHQALDDVEESAVFIGADNLRAALRFLDAVEETMQLLLENLSSVSRACSGDKSSQASGLSPSRVLTST
jgi:plasmid stabilization system protein ParE